MTKSLVSITGEDGVSFDLDLDRLTTTYTYLAHQPTTVSYDIVVEVCNNDGLCSTPVGTGTVTADKEVTGATATDVTVTTDYANKKYTVNWKIEGDLTDVKHWMVCHDSKRVH